MPHVPTYGEVPYASAIPDTPEMGKSATVNTSLSLSLSLSLDTMSCSTEGWTDRQKWYKISYCKQIARQHSCHITKISVEAVRWVDHAKTFFSSNYRWISKFGCWAYEGDSIFSWQLKFSRIPNPTLLSWDLASLFGDPPSKLEDPLELSSAMSLFVIAHHDSYKYAFKTFPFQQVAVVVCLVIERCDKVRKIFNTYFSSVCTTDDGITPTMSRKVPGDVCLDDMSGI